MCCLIADLLPKRRNAQNRFPLYGFGAILGVFFRYERLCFDGGILAVCHSNAAVCRFRVTKSAVLLRRFCLARKMEQGNTIQLFVMLFLPAGNRYTNGSTAADKQQGNPQCKVACIAGLRRFGIVLQLRRYGVCFFHRFLLGLFCCWCPWHTTRSLC